MGRYYLVGHSGTGKMVRLGSRVTIVDMETGDKEQYLIVGSAEADPQNGRISHESPVGRALLGHKVNDVVTVQAPQGVMKFKITYISNK